MVAILNRNFQEISLNGGGLAKLTLEDECVRMIRDDKPLKPTDNGL
jgi:hypothetical protein